MGDCTRRRRWLPTKAANPASARNVPNAGRRSRYSVNLSAEDRLAGGLVSEWVVHIPE